jgi:hypothetical protein
MPINKEDPIKATLVDLLALRDQFGSVFVVGGCGPEFWNQRIDAYPFGSDVGVLLIRTHADECRYPRYFATPVKDGGYVLTDHAPIPLAEAFADRWNFHLQGIVEHSPPSMRLPEWAFPPDLPGSLQLHS